MNVRLHIEKLVLHGFEPVSRARLDAALSAELTRLMAEGGAEALPGASGSVDTLSVGAIHAAPDVSPERLGVQIAQAVYGGLRR